MTRWRRHSVAGCCVLRAVSRTLRGRAARRAGEELETAARQSTKLVVDLSGVDEADSSLWVSIARATLALRKKDGDLKICGCERPVRSALVRMALHRFVDLVPSVVDARDRFELDHAWASRDQVAPRLVLV